MAGGPGVTWVQGGVPGRRFSGPGWRMAVGGLHGRLVVAFQQETHQQAGSLVGRLTAGGSWRAKLNAFGG